ncbi:FeoA family protein [Diplocloster modestus]|uniref:Ferrous iron transport protein A n=1 Tax=Diplocloster modestus TaxID=2850322 RepID=A0ABS6KEF9_9FIRM|nr:FeoA family protein [Diplocloster modestus]MBU9728876.1 ferrous iron transport protein A [Diplocloster modestus]
MKKLSEAKNGEQGVISDIQGDTRFLSRVTSIGLTLGCPVTVLQNEKKRPILIYSRDSMVALNREECDKIRIGGQRG